MKRVKRYMHAILCCAIACTSLAFCSCKTSDTPPTSNSITETCAHQFANYVVKDPTCTEKGVLECLCVLCGFRQYLPLEYKSHTLVDNGCIVCGYGESFAIDGTDSPNVPPKQGVGWSFDSVYQKFAAIYPCTKDEFIREFLAPKSGLTDIYVTKYGTIDAKAINGTQTHDVLLLGIREKFDYPTNDTFQIISQILIDRTFCSLAIQYADGTLVYLGYISDLIQNNAETRAIKRIIVNTKNEVFLVYTDNVVEHVGNLSIDPKIHKIPTLVYTKHNTDDGYEICGATDATLSSLVIPHSHRGEPVRSISIGAFLHFENLQTVIIPTSIKHIYSHTFPEGTKIFTDFRSIPLGWHHQILNVCDVYLQGEWELIDGVPTPKK